MFHYILQSFLEGRGTCQRCPVMLSIKVVGVSMGAAIRCNATTKMPK